MTTLGQRWFMVVRLTYTVGVGRQTLGQRWRNVSLLIFYTEENKVDKTTLGQRWFCISCVNEHLYSKFVGLLSSLMLIDQTLAQL